MSSLFKTTGFFEGERTFKTVFDYWICFDESSTIKWFDSENEFQLFQMQTTDLSLLVGAYEENFKYLEDHCFKDPIIIELYGEVVVKMTSEGWVEILYEGNMNEETGIFEQEKAKTTIEELKSIYGAYKLMKKEQVEFDDFKRILEQNFYSVYKDKLPSLGIYESKPSQDITTIPGVFTGDSPAFKPFTF